MPRRLLGLTGALFLVACTGSSAADSSTTASPGETPSSVAPTSATSTAVETPTTSFVSTTAPTTTTTTLQPYLSPADLTIESYPVPAGSRPHDVAPAADGGVWYTAQNLGEIGWLDPDTGETVHIPLGEGSRPHGVIVDDEGTPWITDGGLNAIVSVDPESREVMVFPLPDERPAANLNTATFSGGMLWFTGQDGIYASLNPSNGDMDVYDAPGGRGPYGITTTPDGSVYYASLAGSYVGVIADDGTATALEPPTPEQGARRVWSDSQGNIWVSEWNSGSLSRFVPATEEWTTWPLPGDEPATYAVYVDEADIVWVSDFGANAMVRFDPAIEEFIVYPLPHDPGEVRQILGRPGEVWGAESAADHLIVIRTR